MKFYWHFLLQGVGKSTLAKKIAESWKCILIDGNYNSCIFGPNIIFIFTSIQIFVICFYISDTDLLNTHIKNKTKEGKEVSIEQVTVPFACCFFHALFMLIMALELPCLIILALGYLI